MQEDDYIYKILDTLESCTYHKGDIVLAAGEAGDSAGHFYLILDGEVLVVQTNGEKSSSAWGAQSLQFVACSLLAIDLVYLENVAIARRTLYQGAHFGEASLCGTVDVEYKVTQPMCTATKATPHILYLLTACTMVVQVCSQTAEVLRMDRVAFDELLVPLEVTKQAVAYHQRL